LLIAKLKGVYMLDDKIQRMVDRADIVDCLHRYARGMDRLDRALARSAYHEDAIDDHAAFVGTVDEFLDWAFAYHSTQARHQHYVSNHNIELAGDEAHVESYYLFVATERDALAPLKLFGGRYVDRFERRDGRWAIANRACLPEWHTESAIPEFAAQMADHAEGNVIARDVTDTSYIRPLVVKRRS
jgi:hypothetical protein